MVLTTNQIAQYEQDGFLLIQQALLPEQLSELQKVTRQFIDDSRRFTANNDVYDLDVDHSADNPRLNRIKTPHMQHELYWDVLCSERIVSYLKPLLGENIRLHNSKLNAKAGQGGAAVQWHQDWSFYPHTNDDLLALGIMLSDISEEDGPLQVVPGSHKGDVLPHDHGGVFCGAVDPKLPEARLDEAVTLTGKAGDMSIHHVRTLHGSAPNLSNSPRLLLLYECGAADAWPIAGGQSIYTGMEQVAFWEKMSSNLICGEQSLRPRLANVPVYMPLPPAPDSSSLFKVQQSGGAVDGFKN
ncbi:MAG: phytanoyl-CoA dioxygenase family protein [Thiolinea sp.]